jgi:2,4-dienoyl-CoA reductase (NADPH2)
VVVIDEIGFHHATSVAELLADRGCAVEVITPGMVVGQDLGITLDMETFNMRAHAKGIRQATDLVVLGAAGADGESGSGSSPDSGGVVLTLLHHPTGESAQRPSSDGCGGELRDGGDGSGRRAGGGCRLRCTGGGFRRRGSTRQVTEGERVGVAL